MAENRPMSYEVVSPILGRWVHANVYPSSNGGLSCYFQDITARKEAEAERESLMAELSRTNEDLRQFAYVLTHDLQAPLRMVRTYTELLDTRCKENLDAAGQEFVGFILDGASRMDELIRGLLSYSQLGHSTGNKDVSLTGVVEGVLSTFTTVIDEAQATITYDPLPAVTGDPVQLLQLFQNLIGNAIKYRRADAIPRIHIAVEARGTEWFFSLRDNGMGIDANQSERIFLPLTRLHSHEIPGTGLGLAICKRIVERNGGRIWVESEVGKGSTFYFTLHR
jgi:light-regulated signal transduction histidine kinase (bacteriophytochrome)